MPFSAHQPGDPITPETPDADLLRRAADRDAMAFAELYDRHSTLVYSVAMKILADPSEARDVLQDVFLALHEKAGTFDPSLGRVAGWLLTMARNRSIDRLRSLKRQRDYAERVWNEQPDEQAGAAAVAPATYPDEVRLLRKAVAGLPVDQRQALELAYFVGLTQQEISDKLSQPLGTVKARIRRGLLKLREVLEGLL